MKRLAAFILILATSFVTKVSACGPFYPYGDDIRFVLLKPGTFNYPGFSMFSYSADVFYDPSYNGDIFSVKDSIDENIQLWRKRCNNIPLLEDVYLAIYTSGDEINNSKSSNTFIAYLHKSKDIEAIRYLNFARKCNPFNSVMEDPWERNENVNSPARKKLIDEALKVASTLKEEDLKLRYAFLSIRLAYYNDDVTGIQSIFNQYFSTRKKKNIIDYWALYFRTTVEPNDIKRNYYASQVFAQAPDKRFSIFFKYDKEILPEKIVSLAKTKEEKAAIWMMAGFRKTGKSLEILKQLYKIKPDLDGLSFLLLREINKLEDWIYTPYYTNFSPSLESSAWESAVYPAKRIQDDRLYARELLTFVDSANLATVENPVLWKTAKAYLNYMVQDYQTALSEFASLQIDRDVTKEVKNILDILKSICLTAQQTAIGINPDVKPVLMREFDKANYKFIFAIARELEYKGNTTDAAILLSKLRERGNEYDWGYYRNGVYWITTKRHYTLFVDYYDDYFFYLDAQYTITQVSDLIEDIKHKHSKDHFSAWKYATIKNDLPRLYDLLGTKHLRGNDLQSALKSFEKVSDTLWTSNSYYYKTYLDANPFYTNFYNEHSKTFADTVHYNKVEITRMLINYLNKAEHQTKNKDYNYFLAANCYFNMTHYGNSWMMKRYFWTGNLHATKLEDDGDYFSCTLAKQFYLKAKEVTKNPKFAALCLRMAGRCEEYRLNFVTENIRNAKMPANVYYNKLKQEYPNDYDELISNCESFTAYFNSRI